MGSESWERLVASARKSRDAREKGYREQSLKIHPWVCARCGKEFTRANLHLLTVHHKDHDHDNNPPDGSNWENLCVYCHDNEHQRFEEQAANPTTEARRAETSTYNPFAALADKLKKG